jgi:hypothetical protein
MNGICVGQRAEGKTTLAIFLALQHSRLVFIFDPRGMAKAKRVYTSSQLLEAAKAAADDIKQRRIQGQIIAFVPQTGDIESEFHEFSEALFPPGFPRHNFSCIVDEAGQLQKSNSVHPDLDRIVRQAPRNVLLLQTTHSLQDFYRASKDLMDDLYVFKMKGRSLTAAVEYMDGGDEMKQAITNLPPHHFLYYMFARHCGPEFVICDDPSLWYVEIDSRAQQVQSKDSGEDEVEPYTEPSPDGSRGKTMLSERWVQ